MLQASPVYSRNRRRDPTRSTAIHSSRSRALHRPSVSCSVSKPSFGPSSKYFNVMFHFGAPGSRALHTPSVSSSVSAHPGLERYTHRRFQVPFRNPASDRRASTSMPCSASAPGSRALHTPSVSSSVPAHQGLDRFTRGHLMPRTARAIRIREAIRARRQIRIHAPDVMFRFENRVRAVNDTQSVSCSASDRRHQRSTNTGIPCIAPSRQLGPGALHEARAPHASVYILRVDFHCHPKSSMISNYFPPPPKKKKIL